MIAPRANRARQQRREILITRLLTLPLPLLAFGLGMVAVDLTTRDGPRQCLAEVSTFLKDAESSLPSDPVQVSLLVRQATTAAELCGKGDAANAQEVLKALRESLRV